MRLECVVLLNSLPTVCVGIYKRFTTSENIPLLKHVSRRYNSTDWAVSVLEGAREKDMLRKVSSNVLFKACPGKYFSYTSSLKKQFSVRFTFFNGLGTHD